MFAQIAKAPRPGLEPGTNRLTGAWTNPAFGSKTPCFSEFTAFPAVCKAVRGRKSRARIRGNSARCGRRAEDVRAIHRQQRWPEEEPAGERYAGVPRQFLRPLRLRRSPRVHRAGCQPKVAAPAQPAAQQEGGGRRGQGHLDLGMLRITLFIEFLRPIWWSLSGRISINLPS